MACWKRALLARSRPSTAEPNLAMCSLPPPVTESVVMTGMYSCGDGGTLHSHPADAVHASESPRLSRRGPS